MPNESEIGKVYLVGAGPGDPELLTLRGRCLLRQADLIFYDNLAAPAVLGFASAEAERVYVGKKRAQHSLSQEQIHRKLIAAAREGKTVVRLKGGDPYIFGRGGEEAAALAAAGIRFEVVPGVTSAVGAAAYAGIPLTHRDYTQAVTFVTGHDVERVDWSAAAGTQTVVVFMGLTTIAEISRRLQAAGRSAETPAAAIRWGTRGDQATVEGTLGDLARRIAETALKPPALIVIGDVVKLRDRANWFENLPLFGQSIVVTRAAAQAPSFSRRLRELGGYVIEVPTIAFEPPESWAPADRAIDRLSSYHWLVFTSANGVNRFVDRLDASRCDLRDIRAKICAIGPATAACLEDLHLKVDLAPKQFVAESLLEALGRHELQGKKVLIPRAALARELLPRDLAAAGAEVDVVPVYRTVLPKSSRALAAAAWTADKAPDWVVVTSSSTVANLTKLAPLDRLKRSRLASIGPITSAAARERGLEVAVEASPYTTDGLLGALLASAPLLGEPSADG